MSDIFFKATCFILCAVMAFVNWDDYGHYGTGLLFGVCLGITASSLLRAIIIAYTGVDLFG